MNKLKKLKRYLKRFDDFRNFAVFISNVIYWEKPDWTAEKDQNAVQNFDIENCSILYSKIIKNDFFCLVSKVLFLFKKIIKSKER